MISTLLTLLIVGIIAIMVLSVIGVVFGLAVGLLFKVGPLVLAGYIVMRLLAPRRRRLSAEDRKWLES